MRFPKRLKIGANIYRVVVKKDLEDSGTCDTEKCLIEIKKQKKSQMWATLFHEVIHAMNIQMSHREVEWISQGFWQILYDNNLLKP